LHSGQRRSSTNRSSHPGHSYTTHAVVALMRSPFGAGARPASAGPVTRERRCAPSSHQYSGGGDCQGAAGIPLGRTGVLHVASANSRIPRGRTALLHSRVSWCRRPVSSGLRTARRGRRARRNRPAGLRAAS
jgi:hypothetical protein